MIVLMGLALLALGVAIGWLWQLRQDWTDLRCSQARRVRGTVSDMAEQRRLAEDRMYRAVQDRRPR